MSSEYKIILCMNASPASYKALTYTHTLISNLKCPYKLIILYVVALNPPQPLPFIDHLEKSYNSEIQYNAQQETQALLSHIKSTHPEFSFEFIQIEGDGRWICIRKRLMIGETGKLIEEFVTEKVPDLDLLVVGTRNQTAFKRWVLGSVSDYCIHHLKCPVAVIKENDQES